METTVVKRPHASNRHRQLHNRSISTVLKQLEEGSPKNRVVVEDGEVKTLLYTETVTPEEARQLLYDMIDLEYSLP